MARKKKFNSRSRSQKHRERQQDQKKSHPPKQEFRREAPPREIKTFKGRVQKNPKGFAFLICSDPFQPDCYIPREEAKSLMDGDTVSYRIHREGKRTFGEVLKIETRGQKEILGVFGRRERHTFIETAEGDIHLVDSPPQKVNPGDWVIGKITSYPSEKSYGRVEIDEIVGKELLPKHDVKVTLSRFGIPHRFSSSVIENAQHACEWGEEELKKPSPHRKDLRELPFVTVDGEDAKDFDDAILVVEPEKGPKFILYVAIADVSFFVRPGSALDKSAIERSTSVYFPGICIPMLPEELSNDLCSLRPQEDKLTLTAEIHLDAWGEVVDVDFYESIIRTTRRMTYTELQGYFDANPEFLEKLAPLKKPIESAKKLFQIFRKRRDERGVLDFELPEMKVAVDKEGRPTGVIRAPHWDAHRLIEEFMVAANATVAKALKETHTPALYRIHEPPSPETIDEINELMKSLGISQRIEDINPRDFARILRVTKNIKGSKTLHQAILRMQKQARYGADPMGHFGLALADYCHFTSPIRRYPDLIVHRALKKVINPKENAEKTVESMDFLGEKTSACERRSMEAERFITKRKACWFMSERLGEVYGGEIASLTPKGIFVEIPEFGIDGFCPMESLNGYYEYDERRNCLRRRPGHSVLSVGDPLTIRVVRVVVADNQIEFEEAKDEQ